MIFIQQSKKGDYMLNNLGKGLLAVSLLAGFIGCTKGKLAEDSTGGGDSSTLTIAGTMSVLQSGSALTNQIKVMGANGNVRWRALSDYRLACATFESIPSACGGSVANDGSFSVSCDGFAEKPFGCFIYHTSTYESYDMVFNVEGEENQIMTAGAGTMSAAISIDTETGLAQTEVELPAEQVVQAPTVTASDISDFDGIFYLGPAPYSSVSSKFTTVELAALRAPITFWTQTTCPTGSTADQQNPNKCSWTPATAQQGYDFSACRMMSNDDAQCAQSAMAGSVTFPSTTQIKNGMGMPVYFKSSADANSKPFLSVWPSEANYQACGSNDQALVWKLSDGTGGQPDVTINMGTSSTSAATLLSNLSTSLSSAIDQWFPILKALDGGNGSGTTYTVQASDVTCKFGYDLPPEFQMMSPEQVTACQADTSNGGCKSYAHDNNYFDALWKYKQAKLFAGATINANDPIFGNTTQINLADFVKNDSDVTLAAGVWGGFDNQTQQPTITEVTGASMMDVGGCISWKDMSDPNSVSKVVEVGKWYKVWEGNNYVPRKCDFSQKMLLVAGTSQEGAWIDLPNDSSTQLYREAFPIIKWTASSVNYSKMVWGKACGINADGNAGVDFIEQYPHDETKANIATNFNNRMNGGSQQDRDGLKLRVVMNLLNSKDGGSNVDASSSFHYYNNQSHQQETITCRELADPADNTDSGTAAQAFDRMGEIVHSTGDYNMAKAMACFLSGVGNGNYESVDFSSFTPLNTLGKRQAYFDCTDDNGDGDCTDNGESMTGNNVPNIIEKVSANSCIPQVQVTRICTDSGCGEVRPLCTDFSAENGGCHDANPISRMALMKVTQVDTGKYTFSQKEERYEFQYDHRTNTSKQCTYMNMLTINNETAVTAPPASGDAIVMMFNEKKSEICDGQEASAPEPARKQYMYFVK